MRAKLAFALAAITALAGLASSQTANAWNSATYDVQRILNGGTNRHLLRSVVGMNTVRSYSAVVAPGAVVATDACAAPLTLAPTIIRTDYPSDLDIRRLELTTRINSASALGRLDPVASADLKNAMLAVNQAEVSWRSAGTNLSYEASRRLYKAMDKIGSDLDYYGNRNSVNLLGVRIVPTSSWY